jgi:hypothetical protein
MKTFRRSAILLVALAPHLHAQTEAGGNYHGWKSIRLENEFNRLEITPDLGGRIIQLEFNGAKLFWENPRLYGQSSPETGLDENGEWMNYGGEKIWPAPQGWDNDRQWGGRPDPVLDGGVYQSEIREGNII